MEPRKVTEPDTGPGESWIPNNDSERTAIREQLERILASPLFKNSKRYPLFLRYVVEQKLAGEGDRIKERTLGVELFGRDPDYDTNSDHSVRSTAGEIRKRIAQYYHQPGRQKEITIDLPSGSYVPEFRRPPEAIPLPLAPAVIPQPPAPRFPRRKWTLYIAAALVLAVVAAAPAWVNPSNVTTLDRFWNPVMKSPGPVLFCVAKSMCLACDPEPKAAEPTQPNVNAPSAVKTIALADAVTMARLAGLFEVKNREYRFRLESFARFQDLRDGPVLLIGGFNNSWTMRLNDQLHFVLGGDPSKKTYWIQDREGGAKGRWQVQYTPDKRITQDYALISRVLDATTGHMTVAVAGIGGFGTRAAGEFLTNPAYFETVARHAPAGWEQKNMQLVLSTRVIDETAGKPELVGSWFW